MLPQNKKTWAHPLDQMNKDWIAERVSIVDLKRIIKNIIFKQDDVSWGPNNQFKFPLYGGTGGLFNKFMPYVKDNLQLNRKLAGINLDNKTIKFTDGQKMDYDILINTSPLDILVNMLSPKNDKLLDAAGMGLEHNSGHIIGVGIQQACPSNKCWMYFPQGDSPFYRTTYFSNYSPNNVPKGKYYSLMCETSFSPYKQVDKNITELTLQGLENSKLISNTDRNDIVSTYQLDVEHLYPIPTLKRNDALRIIQPYLKKHDIYSRGRFGGWLYEVGNMDHSVMQGVETVDYILSGKAETTWKID